MIAGLFRVVPSSKAGNVTRLIAFCVSLLDPGHGCWTLLLSHCAEHISETKSYATVFNVVALNGIALAGTCVASVVGVLVCVDSGDGVGVFVGANITFTCTQICPLPDEPSPNCFPSASSNDQIPL